MKLTANNICAKLLKNIGKLHKKCKKDKNN